MHQAWYVDRLLQRDPRWGITGVSLHSPGVRDALQPQDGLYTLAVQDEVPSIEVIGSLREVVVATDEPAAVVRRLADSRLARRHADRDREGLLPDARQVRSINHTRT